MWKPGKLTRPVGWALSKVALLRPRGRWVPKMAVGAAMACVAVAAFCCGRWGTVNQATATPPGQPGIGDRLLVPGAATDYSSRVVAYIHGNMPITREDLGEFLIQRYGGERVEVLVNRRIIDLACQARGIVVTDAEIQAQLSVDLKNLGPTITEKDFEQQILKRFNKSLLEWKEDVIRPKLALAKMGRKQVMVTEEDVRKGFEARYGEKVQCRMIVFEKGDRHKFDVHKNVSESEEQFRDYARKQFIPALAAKGGEVPPIHRHFGDPNVEKEAFSLKPGQVSRLLEMPDGTTVILKCDKLLPPDTTRKLEEERLALHKEIAEFKLNQEIPKIFKQLRDEARPVILLRPRDVVQEVRRELNLPAKGGVQQIADPPR